MLTKDIAPAYEFIGKTGRRRITGYVGTLMDGDTVIHAREYPNSYAADVALDRLIHDLLSSDMVLTATALDGSQPAYAS